MVRWVKTHGADITKGTRHLAVKTRTQGIAAIFNQPQVIFIGNFTHLRQVKQVAQGVRHHDCLGFFSDCCLNQLWVDVIGWNIDIDKHRHQTILDSRVNRGREARSNGNHLITGF
ncbi:hypothetical protein D3C84_1033190 [compost metagenome]